MKGLLRWMLWLLVLAGVLAGAACIASFGSPMQVVLPLRALLAACGGGLVVLAGALWWLDRPARKPAIVALLGLGLLGLSAVRTLAAPDCREFDVTSGPVRLAGSACLPSVERPVPTAIFVHGSGPVTRHEYRFFAEGLAESGIAAVIYDKRGSGASTGGTYDVGYGGYAEDLVAVADWAREQEFSRATEIGFIGYSEAEWVMPIAARRFSPAFLVVIGASGLTPAQQVSEEIAIRLSSAGFGEEGIRDALNTNRKLGEYLRGDISAEQFEAILDAAKNEPWFEAAEDLPDDVYDREDYAWWRGVMDFDPGAAWSQYGGPVLFLKGTADDRSHADRAVERVSRMLDDPKRQLTVRLFEGADHGLLTWPLGDRVPPPSFAAGYPKVLGEWILEQTSGGAGE